MDFAQPLNIEGELASSGTSKKDRKAARAEAQIEAGLRQRGFNAVSIKVLDISTNGFRASTHLDLTPGTDVWLKLPGLEPWLSKVVWMDGYLIGCEFARPLHPAVLDTILRSAR